MQAHVQSDAPLNLASLEVMRELRVEADAIEASHGPNPYSDYLRKHGRRPTRDEAFAMGKVLGWRLKAEDESMQPPFTAADRKAQKAARSERDEFARQSEIVAAIVSLARYADGAVDIAANATPCVQNNDLVAQIKSAVLFLSRFAEQLNGSPQKAGTEELGTRY